VTSQVIGHVIEVDGGWSRDGKGLVSRWKMKKTLREPKNVTARLVR